MNYASMVNDSISPSTQSSKAYKQTTVAVSSFQCTYAECVKETEAAENSSAQSESVKDKAKELISELETMQTVMDDLKGVLSGFFAENNIPKDPPIEISYDKETGDIKVAGDRDDADIISQLINSDEDVKAGVKDALDRGQMLLTLAHNIAEFNGRKDTGEVPEVGLVYGSKTSISTNRDIPTTDLTTSEVSTEQSELEEMFKTIKHLMLLMFIKKDPEEEEKKQAAKGSDNGAVEDPAEPDEEPDGLTEYRKLLVQIEQARAQAVFMHGEDKNKYAMAVQSYSMVKHIEETRQVSAANDVSGEEPEDNVEEA